MRDPAGAAATEPQAHVLPVTTGSPRFESVDLGAFRVSDSRFPAGLRLAPHGHERISFFVVLEGSLDVLLAGRTHQCLAGTVETKPAGERHGNRFGGAGARVVVVEPAPEAADALGPAARLLDAPHCFPDPVAAKIARRLAAELRADDALAPLGIEGLVLELLVQCTRRATALRASSDPPGWLLAAREVLIGRFREPLRAGVVANEVGVHPAYLARRFRAHFGTTMADFVRLLRLDWAARQLAGSGDSIAAIAAQAGFTDQSCLTRAFRARFGTTPGAVRRRIVQDGRR
ncbi:MAG TPA: AraC family transcriptional regulator [Gemmatimonadaceae bacterium]|nr:AraC family transcriptional regulator [Gemmatimonadaceae bacterium]